MSSAVQRLAPWSDWVRLDHESAIWFSESGVDGTLTATAFAADQLDVTAGLPFSGGAAPKPTFLRPTGQASSPPAKVGFFRLIPIPGFVMQRNQPGRLAEWNGESTTAMGDGGRRVALQVVNVFSSRSSQDVVGADLTGFTAAAKYKGYGATLLAATTTFDVGTATEDAPVASNTLGSSSNIASGTFPAFGGASTTAFPDLALPSDTGGTDPNAAPTFDPNGVCTIMTIFDIPSTVQPNAMLELMQMIQIPLTGQGAASVPVQWQYSYYRWLKGGPDASYPIYPNTSAQITGEGDLSNDGEQPYASISVDEP